MDTKTTLTVKPLGDDFAVFSAAGNVHSVFPTLADAEAAAVRISQRENARQAEGCYY